MKLRVLLNDYCNLYIKILEKIPRSFASIGPAIKIKSLTTSITLNYFLWVAVMDKKPLDSIKKVKLKGRYYESFIYSKSGRHGGCVHNSGKPHFLHSKIRSFRCAQDFATCQKARFLLQLT